CRTDCHGCLFEVRPSTTTFLAGECDGGSNPGVSVSSFGHHGEAGRVSAGPTQSCTCRHQPVDAFAYHIRNNHHGDRCDSGNPSHRSETHSGLQHHRFAWHLDHTDRYRPPRQFHCHGHFFAGACFI